MAACSAHSAMRRVFQQSLFSASRFKRTLSKDASTSSQVSSSDNASASASASDAPSHQSDTASTAGVQLSDACVRQLQRLSADGSVLRLAVDGGGCSGFQYVFSLADANTTPQSDDVLLERDGVRVLVDRVSLEYVRGATIDYHEELIRSAFRIIDNPQSEQGCSCGSSFSIKID